MEPRASLMMLFIYIYIYILTRTYSGWRKLPKHWRSKGRGFKSHSIPSVWVLASARIRV